MKKIGQGLQFNIYQKGNSKVVKIPTSKIQTLFKLLSWNPFYWLRPILLIKRINRAASQRENSIKNIKKIKLNRKLLANPIFRKKEIEQERVIPLGNYLKKDFKEAKKYIDKYIESTFETWSYGFSDRVFNIIGNSGVDKSDRVALIDFGELTFSKERVSDLIKKKRWKKTIGSKIFVRKKIRKYYYKKMKEKLTVSNLNKYWKSKIK